MESAEQDRSERPTPYKLTRARRKGTVARGADLGFMVSLAALLAYLWFQGASLGGSLALAARQAIVTAPGAASGQNAILEISGHVLGMAAQPVGVMAAVVFLAVLALELIQTGPVFSTEPLRPDFRRLDPGKGLKRLLSVRLLVETGKTLLKFLVYVTIAVLIVRQAVAIDARTITDAPSLAAALSRVGFRLAGAVTLAAVLFAALDQLIVRRDFLKRMRMSRREVRRESRDREGDPRLKQKRKRLHAEFVKLSQSLRNVRGADLLVTNPTHYAVALRYDASAMTAPAVVSLGADRLAVRLKALALLYGVVIVENRVLAKALYHAGRIDREIPDAFYRPVADLYMANRAALLKKKGMAS